MKHFFLACAFSATLLTPLGPKLGATADVDPEPPGPMAQRLARCRHITWNGITYPIVLCPTGIVWARWTPTYSYCGHWKVEANVLTITWEASYIDSITGKVTNGHAPPIVSQVRAIRLRAFELTDLPQGTSITLSE